MWAFHQDEGDGLSMPEVLQIVITGHPYLGGCPIHPCISLITHYLFMKELTNHYDSFGSTNDKVFLIYTNDRIEEEKPQ